MASKNSEQVLSQAEIDRRFKDYQAAVHASYLANSGIDIAGKRIVVPVGMSLLKAAQALQDAAENENEEVETEMNFRDCHPNDALVAFVDAVGDTFGAVLGMSRETFLGRIPAEAVSIPIDHNQERICPVGLVQIPSLPDIKFNVKYMPSDSHPDGGLLDIVAYYKRKDEQVIKDIERLTKDHLASNSIFTGKAVTSDFRFWDSQDFDPESVVYSKKERSVLEGEILSAIRFTDQYRLQNMSLKIGMLMYGNYGSGKSLTARLLAYYAIQHRWSFMVARPGANVIQVLNFARRQQPCVVFFEDIEMQAPDDTERSEGVSAIINEADGIFGKKDAVILVMTTNFENKINAAMRRAGRIDVFLKTGEYEAERTINLIKTVARNKSGESLLAGELDEDEVVKAAQDYPPAFIVLGVKKAMQYALVRQTTGNRITSDDVVAAMESLRDQFAWMRDGDEGKKADGTTIEGIIAGVIREALSDPLSAVSRDMARVRHDVVSVESQVNTARGEIDDAKDEVKEDIGQATRYVAKKIDNLKK